MHRGLGMGGNSVLSLLAHFGDDKKLAPLLSQLDELQKRVDVGAWGWAS